MNRRKAKEKKQQEDEEQQIVAEDANSFELSVVERNVCKENFTFYDKARQGWIERFELPQILQACGYNLTDARIAELNQFLDKRGSTRIDVQTLLAALTHLKEIELQAEQESESDEYLDCFVSLGGQPDKDGFVSKDSLIQIIKEEFELTIDMEEFLRKVGGDSEEINYYYFCVLLDAGTGGNPSRVSSYLSQNKGSSAFMRFSYFINNMDKIQFK